MIGGVNQSQSSGDSSHNYQAKNLTIINPDEATIRSIVDKQITARLNLLTGEAFDTYKLRCQDFTDGLISALNYAYAPHIERLREPSVQFSINEAQKAFGESGDEDVKRTLISLIGKMCSAPNNTLDRVYKDAIDVVRRMTTKQLNLICIHITLWNLDVGLKTFDDYISWLIQMTSPFVNELPIKPIELQYLEHIGIAKYQIGSVSFRTKQRQDFAGLFQKGMTLEEVRALPEGEKLIADYFIPCFHDANKLQTAFVNEKQITDSVPDENLAAPLRLALNTHIMDNADIDHAICRMYPKWTTIVEFIERNKLDQFFVGTVGQALAVLTIEERCKTSIGIDGWL